MSYIWGVLVQWYAAMFMYTPYNGVMQIMLATRYLCALV
jgi:hypothetical protein